MIKKIYQIVTEVYEWLGAFSLGQSTSCAR